MSTLLFVFYIEDEFGDDKIISHNVEHNVEESPEFGEVVDSAYSYIQDQYPDFKLKFYTLTVIPA